MKHCQLANLRIAQDTTAQLKDAPLLRSLPAREKKAEGIPTCMARNRPYGDETWQNSGQWRTTDIKSMFLLAQESEDSWLVRMAKSAILSGMDTASNTGRWFQNTRKTRLALVAFVLTLAMASVLVVKILSVIRQRSAREAVEASGGRVGFEYEEGLSGRISLGSHLGTPPGSAWVSELLGVDFVSDVVSVEHVNSDALARVLSGFPKLRHVRLESPQVTDAAIECLKLFPQLDWIDLNDTSVTATGLDCLKELRELKGLRLDGKNVTDDWLELLARNGQLQKMTALYVSHSRITDAGLAFIKTSTRLQFFEIQDANVTDAGLENLKRLTSLRSLGIEETHVTGSGLENLKDMTNLLELGLGNTQVTDAGLQHLKGLTSLKGLNLFGTRVTDAGLENLKGLTSLKCLSLIGTHVTDAGLENLKELTSLEGLSLSETRVTDAGLQYLAGLSQLHSLDLQNTQITDAGLDQLVGLRHLVYLDIDDTKVTREGVEKFKSALPQCGVIVDNLYFQVWPKQP